MIPTGRTNEFMNPDTPGACPGCGKAMEACTSIGGGEAMRGPQAGDISICVYCATVLIFEDDTHLREAEDHEIPDRIRDYQEKVSQFIQLMKGADEFRR